MINFGNAKDFDTNENMQRNEKFAKVFGFRSHRSKRTMNDDRLAFVDVISSRRCESVTN